MQPFKLRTFLHVQSFVVFQESNRTNRFKQFEQEQKKRYLDLHIGKKVTKYYKLQQNHFNPSKTCLKIKSYPSSLINQFSSMQNSLSVSERTSQAIQAIRKLNPTDTFKFGDLIKSVIASEELDNWIVLNQLITNKQLCDNIKLHKAIIEAIDKHRVSSESYPMVVFIYGYSKQNKAKISTYKTAGMLRTFTQQGKLLMLTSWLSSANLQQPSVSQTIKMLTKYYPTLVKQECIKIQQEELELILQLLCHANLKSSQQFQDFDQLCLLLKKFAPVKDIHDKNKGFFIPKEQLIIKATLDVLADSKTCTGSASWIFIPPSLGKNDIQSFTHNFSSTLLLFKDYQLINIFSKLFDSSLEENTLVLFAGVTRQLQKEEKFFELKLLYQKIVLPILIRRGKAKQNLTKQVLTISTRYVVGFYSHCQIGANGMICMLSNIDKIEDKEIQDRWIELAFLISDKNRPLYTPIISEVLSKQKFDEKYLKTLDNDKNFGRFDAQVWEITKRNCRKLKTYPRTQSKDFKGIENKGTQCYIISIMQALFTTKELTKILSDFRWPQRDTLIHKMKALFEDLGNDYKEYITVNDVKDEGPEDFAVSDRQEDAQQYLSKVLEKIEEEMGKSKEKLLLQAFNKAFKSTISRKWECQNCHHIVDRSEEQFIHTIPNRVSLRQVQVEQITDYRCQKCNRTQFQNRIQLHPTSKIFIVHFNRFSYINGKGSKELFTHRIPREFMGYRLKGIVFHIGKKIEFGHYVYYFWKGGKKWVEMNDNNVMEFELENEDEEFEREMRTEITPYILFYVKK